MSSQEEESFRGFQAQVNGIFRDFLRMKDGYRLVRSVPDDAATAFSLYSLFFYRNDRARVLPVF